MVVAIIGLVSALITGIFKAVQGKQNLKAQELIKDQIELSQLPKWRRPEDLADQDYTDEIILFFLLIFIIGLVVYLLRKQ